jgi:hypothetical protein
MTKQEQDLIDQLPAKYQLLFDNFFNMSHEAKESLLLISCGLAEHHPLRKPPELYLVPKI